MLNIGLSKCMMLSGEIILLCNYTVIRGIRYTKLNIPLNFFGDENKDVESDPGSGPWTLGGTLDLGWDLGLDLGIHP